MWPMLSMDRKTRQRLQKIMATNYNGPWIAPVDPNTKAYKQRSRQQQIIKDLANQWSQKKEITVILPPAIQDWKAFYWSDYDQQLTATAVVHRNDEASLSSIEVIESSEVHPTMMAMHAEIGEHATPYILDINEGKYLLAKLYIICEGSIAYLISSETYFSDSKYVKPILQSTINALPKKITKLDTQCDKRWIHAETKNLEQRYMINKLENKWKSASSLWSKS